MQGAVEKPGFHGNPHAPPLLKPVALEENRTPYSLNTLLERGDIDAIVGSRKPAALGRDPEIVRLFPDYRTVEQAYFRATGIFPIMHLVVIRREVYERRPWIASSLYKAFVAAKVLAMQRLRFSGATSSMLPWQVADVEELQALFGEDHWPYGVEQNRSTLEALVQYMAEQNFITEPMPVDDLFVDLPGVSGG